MDEAACVHMTRASIPIALLSALILGVAGPRASAGIPPSDPAAALRVEVIDTGPASRGTYHYADELRLSAPGAEPLVLTSSTQVDRLAPIPGPKFAIGDQRVLLLGWSSTGSGMQAIHVLLLHIAPPRVALQSQFTYTTDRLSSGIVVRRKNPRTILIGIPELPDFGHQEGDWSLDMGPEERLDWDQLSQLHPVRYRPRASDVAYFPPFEVKRAVHRVTWISASAAGLEIAGAR